MRFLMLMALLVGCVPKTAPVVLDTAENARVALVFDSAGPGDPGAVSEALQAAVVSELEARNLRVTVVAPEEFATEFGRRRATGQRLKWLGAGGPDNVLLVEVKTSYYNQINGLFRWTVSAKASMAAPGEELPIDAGFEVPVFLQFHHQQSEEAMDAATDVVRKRVGRLADTVLGSGDGSARAAPPPAEDAPAADDGPEDGSDLGPIYFVLVDRFHNGDPSNDGDADPSDPQAFHGGDLRGVIQKLDHLQAMQVETLWLSPVFRMRTEKIGETWGAYHGYWPTGEPGVEPRFGTDADLIELREELDRRGMKLLLDVVLNHVGYEVPLVTEKPGWFHDLGPIEDWDDPVQATRGQVHGLPDLDHENPEVVAWLDERVAGWIETFRPDGFRLDAVRHIPTGYWRYFTDRVKALAGEDFILLGELFEGDPAKLAATWEAGGFTHMFDFPLYYALTDVLCEGAHPGRLASMLAQDALYADPTKLVTFVDNHDLPRITSRCGERGPSALEIIGALRGTPAVYQGTEFGQDGAEEPANRASVDWDAEVFVRLGDAFHARRSGGHTRVVGLTDSQLSWMTRGAGDGAFVALESTPAGMKLQVNAGPAVQPPEPVADGRLSIAAEGQGVRMVGAGDLLGQWNPDNGIPGLHDSKGRTVFQFDVPGGSVLEYKLVRRGADGSWEWEDRGNRYLFVDGDASVEHFWGS